MLLASSGPADRPALLREAAAMAAALCSIIGSVAGSAGVLAEPCDPPITSEIACENSRPGSPASEWEVSGAGDSSIQGFATEFSVSRGETIRYKIRTSAASYRIDIYRLGYYGGLGARRVASVQPSAPLPQAQPPCLQDSPWTGLRDCGNWAASASWAIPADATSGIYIARPIRLDTGGASHIPFIVRDDEGGSDLLFQTSDTTWQAYNRYGGNDLYGGDGPATSGRAHKLSYNRPFTTRADHSTESVFNAEYPMVRWLEANGYDVSYFAGADTDRRGEEILEHRAFLSVGHDEYVSGGARASLEAAVQAGVHLAFFSGNEVYWKIRWEDSIDGSGSPHRTLVCYKEGTLGEYNCGTKCDPLPDVWTGLWRDGCSYTPPADGCRPENALSGQISWDGTTYSMDVPEPDGKMRFWRDSPIAELSPGQVATLPFGTLGYEWDYQRPEYQAFYPPGRVRMSTTVRGGKTHHLTLYRHPSGALVFGAGTVQWSWGLDSHHDRGSAAPDLSMQQATVNLLADMGVQPATLQPGLVPATTSTDGAPPLSMIHDPLAGSTVRIGTQRNVSGTAVDSSGGRVGGVEVSVNGGTTWLPAAGRESWTFPWTPAAYGSVTIMSRAVDDSGNLETPSAGIAVTVGDADLPPPNVPLASNDFYETELNESLFVPAPGVLANDGDPNADRITAVPYSPPSHGTLSLSPDGSFSYTPVPDFRGMDSFLYRVADPASNLSNLATVTIGVGIACPCNIFSPSTTPASAHFDDRPVTLGVKFRSDVDGLVTGVRFYKDSRNNGAHIGMLWSGAGTLLASAAFTGESDSGWQEVAFSIPVAITANTTYVASYHTETGYPQDLDYFAAGVDNPPLHALRDGLDGSNGVYAYDPSPGQIVFPGSGFRASNYYVDVVFRKPVAVRSAIEPSGVEAEAGGAVQVAVVVDAAGISGRLGSYAASLTWNPEVLEYLGFTGGDPPFETPAVDSSAAAGGSLSFSDADEEGAGGRSRLLSLRFRVLSKPCVTTPLDLAFGSMRTAGSPENLLPSLGIDDGRVSVSDYKFDLRVEDPVNTLLHWTAPESDPIPLSYDVIRGFVHALYSDASTVHLGPVTCLEDNSRDTTTGEGTEPSRPDTGIPAPGRSLFYLVRFHDGLSNQSYGFARQCSIERRPDSRDCP